MTFNYRKADNIFSTNRCSVKYGDKSNTVTWAAIITVESKSSNFFINRIEKTHSLKSKM